MRESSTKNGFFANNDEESSKGLFNNDEILEEEHVPELTMPPESLTYIAHYSSPVIENSVKGFFEFDSIHRASSKQNHLDARIKMLEIYGKEAVSWIIDGTKLKKKSEKVLSDQLEFDFREPKKPRAHQLRKKYL